MNNNFKFEKKSLSNKNNIVYTARLFHPPQKFNIFKTH